MLILYFDEDHRSVMIKFGFLEKYIFIFVQVILCFGFDHRAVVMLNSGLGTNTGMGFHPKNGSHQGMKVRLSIWTFWICDSKTVNGLKAENCKN